MLYGIGSVSTNDFNQLCEDCVTKLFISYARADVETVTKVSQELRAAGYEVWIDTSDIQGGSLWGTEIAKAIVDCDIFLLFLSLKSVQSDFVRREVDIAFDDRKKILPITLEKVEIPVHLDYQLAGIQYIDYRAPDWKSRLLTALGSRSVSKSSLKDTGKLKNPYSSLPVLEPVERILILSNREKELKRGIEHLDHHRLLLVTGMPGIGKSTFARALLEFMPPGSPPPFWYNFERQRSSGNSLGVLLDHISSYLDVCLEAEVRRDVMTFRNSPGGTASVSDVDVLISFLNQETPIWLVFDNLETVLSRDTYEFLDEGLELLFDSLKNNTHNAKIIITNPFVPILKSGEVFLEIGTSALILEGLDDDFTFAFLRAYGLQSRSKEELEPLIREINGHPFVLNHIARYMQVMGSKAIMEDLPGGLEDINERFGEFLEERLSSQEFNALQSLTILNREMRLSGLCQVAQVKQNVIMRLREKGLIQTDDTEHFWLHNIVRNSIQPTEPNAVRQAHVRAMDFYRKQKIPALPQSIDDYANVLEWHHHAVEAGDVISAYSAVYGTGLVDQLMKWNEYDLLSKICERTLSTAYLVEADLAQVQANLSNIERIKLYHTLGIAYILLGEFLKSIAHLESALNLLQSEENDELRIRLLLDLSESYNGNGDHESAMDICQQVADLVSKSQNKVLQAKFLHLRGIVHRDQGNLEQAINDLEGALNLYAGLNKPIHLGNARIDLGTVHYYQNQFADALINYQSALLAFEAQGDMRGIIVARFNIADIMLQNEQFQSALEEIQPALDLARRRKITDLELRAGFMLIEAQIALSRLDEAERELKILQPLITKRAAPCYSGQELVLLAYKYSKQDKPGQALNGFVQALKVLENPACQYEYARGSLLLASFLKEQGELKRAQEALSKARDIFGRLNNQLGLQAIARIVETIPDQ
jgi:tetratricopeptide (TPR) repeat protein